MRYQILLAFLFGIVFVVEAAPRRLKKGVPVVAGPRPLATNQGQLPAQAAPTATAEPENATAGADIEIQTTESPLNLTEFIEGYLTTTAEPDYYYYYDYDNSTSTDNSTATPVYAEVNTTGTPINATTDENGNGLLVRYGQNPVNRGISSFVPLPLTESEAIADEWTLNSDACTAATPTYWRGRRYRLKGDAAVSLLYDHEGKLSGVQTSFTPVDPVVYPDSLIYRNVFNSEGSERVVTVYFKHPLAICNTVNETERLAQGWENIGDQLGDQLFIQTGTDPLNHYAHIHKSETELVSKSMWKPGSCVAGLGRHYWFNATSNTPCENFVPIALLYKDGELNGFSWAFRADNGQAGYSSPRYERLTPPELQAFFQGNMPLCLAGKQLITLHFFFSPQPWTTVCL